MKTNPFRQNIFNWTSAAVAALAVVLITGCAGTRERGHGIMKAHFGRTPDGKDVDLYTLRNANGAVAQIMTYGGIVTTLEMPDKDSQLGDVVLGYDNLDGYVKNNPYFGCIVGRYGNRIAGGKFTLNGKTYTLATNNGPNSLHGGLKGFDKQVWEVVKSAAVNGGATLELRYTSKDGEEGFPGNLTVTTLYTLTADNALRIDYTATTDAATHCNLTHHSYFNLAGSGDILNHEMMIAADKFTPVDATLIPTGELRPLAGSPLDFSKPTKIGARINADDEQLKLGGGYDHNYVINKPAGQLGLAARVYEATSGRVMEVWTTEPGVQFYTGNFLDGTIRGKGGWVYQRRNAFCLEPQHYPDTPNQPSFPTTLLKPGETYQNTIIYKFSTR
jgi:aldose 1-epimerase